MLLNRMTDRRTGQKKMIRRISIRKQMSLFALILCILLSGCGKTGGSGTNEDGKPELPQQELTVGETPLLHSPVGIIMIKDDMVKNPLNGRWIDKKFAGKRPIAVLFENSWSAIPQYGLSYADITYEMYAEDGDTRLMSIITEYDRAEKFEPIRSDRHYFDRKAVEYDAVNVFFGASDYANDNDLYGNQYPYLDFIDLIRDPGLNRDTDRYAPHNAYTVPGQIDQQIEAKGFSKTHRSYYNNGHKFNDEFTELKNGAVAEKVEIPFENNEPWFEYDAEDLVYYRYQFNGTHYDYDARRQLWCTNILIQLVTYTDLPGYESEGLQDIDWTGSGEGFYCTGGRSIPVTWKYENYFTRWYTANGQELKMNPGKTWIAVFRDSDKEKIVFSKQEEKNEEEQ